MIVLLSADDNYIQHASVTIRSVLANASSPEKLSIKLISDNISNRNIHKLEESLSDFESVLNLDVIEIQEQQVRRFNPKTDYLSSAIYHRIYAGQFLNGYSGKVVYLDSDVIVREDIIKLFQVDLGDYSIGAVRNDGLYHQESLGMPKDKVFFNSGILLIDLNKWREREILPKLEAFISENNDSLKYPDQCAMNAILYDDWYSLDPKWNMHRYFFLNPTHSELKRYSLPKRIKSPAIVHFTTRDKPWFFMCSHPFKKEYYKYLKKTAWADYSPPDLSLHNFYLKYVTKIKSFFKNNYIGLRGVIGGLMPLSLKRFIRPVSD
ncbi:glycosyltransferase family 8 protein [Rhodohalobacter sp. 8-1]|uniref:glycosyltransferase family 8 protein n=1 Tax=Rhodohalobacter sp. 8-1 TaxID=3131972 RepID=UPI0030EDAF45